MATIGIVRTLTPCGFWQDGVRGADCVCVMFNRSPSIDPSEYNFKDDGLLTTLTHHFLASFEHCVTVYIHALTFTREEAFVYISDSVQQGTVIVFLCVMRFFFFFWIFMLHSYFDRVTVIKYAVFVVI